MRMLASQGNKGQGQTPGCGSGRKLLAVWLLIILFFPLELTLPAAPAAGQTGTNRAYFLKYDWNRFRQLPQAQYYLDLDRPDIDLLSAAVFHETNRQRNQHKLPILAYDAEVRRAAALQAGIMKEAKTVTHDNPSVPELQTLKDRLAQLGLQPQFAAENVATAFALQYDSGQPFFRRRENGAEILSLTPNGSPIPPHTYLSFATALVKSWMESTGHRKNILHTKAQFLGAECLLDRKATGMPVFYCAQVFFTPLSDPR